MSIQRKLSLLNQKLRSFDSLAVAFSGGVDSTFLLLAAHRVLGEATLAVTMYGPNFNPDEVKEAKNLCQEEAIPHLLIALEQDAFETFSHNPEDRCYICKHAIFSQIKETLSSMPIADGTNADDSEDYRPGRLALKELGIISPLEEIGFTKEDIRQGLRAMNVPSWDKPAGACLASRIPYGDQLTPAKLEAIYQIEKKLKELGFSQVRLRHHGDIARIEVLPHQRHLFCQPEILDKVDALVKSFGFRYATLDLAGYIMGNLSPK